jgi:tRNA pseudouridine55 synthase
MQPVDQPGEIILVNKPLRWTSFDVIRKLRYQLKIKKIGHAGTLDPLATGLLIVCTGKMTKKINDLMGMEKEYTGTFVIGQTTPSYDLETAVSPANDISRITQADLERARAKLTGNILQTPPLHSAIKVDGKRAYELARQGESIELKARPVTIIEFELTAVNLPVVEFRIVCSKGTYIRSIARDFGEVLGVGAYLASLCRTRIGHFKLFDAKYIDGINS